ncbi:YheT family hydrolase [Robiginitomaculum antarcticum]|uniref:YheT family hydrolase n=1 Tax=Robiginitomaculum antarcticum TaxID=437507 RepID=UPI001F2C78B9|nr:alpha/beta fold hydrolase [Robiginitomaculum antarcticum]
MVLDLPDGVRLSGYYSPHPNARGTVMLLHGWEGSVDSTYMLCCGQYLYDQGFNIFRLNYRDHGDSHHLNEGVFYGGLFDEVWHAVKHVSNISPKLPLVLTGFSLGGNFALRVARHAKAEPIDNLRHIFAVSPVIDPLAAAPLSDKNALIKRYFMKKWVGSLSKKAALYPNLYDMSEINAETSIMGMTKRYLRFTPFGTVEDLLNSYRIWPDDLTGVDVPTQIIIARDDPVTPAAHCADLNFTPPVSLIELDHGGHNAFFYTLTGPTWYDMHIARQLEDL